MDLLTEAVDIENIECQPSDLKDDLVEAVSLINLDGLELRFVHRSFQEYFCAHYIASQTSEIAFSCIEAIKARAIEDEVVGMAYALNAPRFQEAWLSVRLKSAHERAERSIKAGKYVDLVRYFAPAVVISGDVLFAFLSESVGSWDMNIFAQCLPNATAFKPDSGFGVPLSNIRDNPLEWSIFLDAISKMIPRDAFASFKKAGRFEEGKGWGIDLGSVSNDEFSEFRNLGFWRILATELKSTIDTWNSLVKAEVKRRRVSALAAFSDAARPEGRFVGRYRGGPYGWR